MILYPFPPGSPTECSITGFDEEKKEPAAELYLLAPGSVPPADFGGGYLFCETPGCRDARLLQPVQTAVPDAPAVWCDTQVSGGSLEGYLRGLLPVWGSRLWVYLAPIRMLFPVPCLSGVGMPLDKAAADALIARYPPHFSEDLACCYCFFRDEAGDARVLLFDTEETCRKKLNLLRSSACAGCLGRFHRRKAPTAKIRRSWCGRTESSAPYTDTGNPA